jgi:hypothetical protein
MLGERGRKRYRSMKKLITMFSAMCMLMFVVACTGLETPEASTDLLLSVEINPAIEFMIGNDERVKSYRLMNEDAEIVAAGLDLVGMNYEDALQAFMHEAIDAGYLDVERNDNAVALMAANGDSESENQFREQVEVKLQQYFQENAIGAVVLNHGELDEVLIAFAEQYELSIGIAKLILSYMEANPEAVLEDVLEMKPSELTEVLIGDHQAFMNTYQNQRQTNALEVKVNMENAVLAKVQAHWQAVNQGTAVQPDMTGVKAMYQANYDDMHQAFVVRNETRKNNAKEKAQGGNT